jgi:hypothetical protein
MTDCMQGVSEVSQISPEFQMDGRLFVFLTIRMID